MKPIINLQDLELQRHDNGPFQAQVGDIGAKIGAKKLGYNLTIVPPGKKAWPMHNHHVNEEMFLILEGTGLLRFGEQEFELKKHDVIAAPPGKRQVAHQIVNTGQVDLKYISLSTMENFDACEYPDSNKISVMVGEDWNDMQLRHITKAEQAIDYWDGEI